MRTKLFTYVFACLFAIQALACLNICSKCGYENDADAVVCKHCETALSPIKTNIEVKVTKSSSGIDVKVINDQLALASAAFARNDAYLALLIYRNAAALNQLVENGDQALGNRILSNIKKCRAVEGVGTKKCPVCEGGGDYVMSYNGLSGEEKTRTVKNKRCETCFGTGTISMPLTINERKFKIGQATKKFGEEQLAKRWVRIGNAWIPGDMEGILTVKQSVALMKAMADPCKECGGFGKVDCHKCMGFGQVICPGKCDHGMVRIQEESDMTKTKLNRTEKCKTCKGKGSVACEECRGQGNVLCGKCGGTGDRPDCNKCGGTGAVMCSKCKGTGEGKDGKCAECRGEGFVLCNSCKGDGKKK